MSATNGLRSLWRSIHHVCRATPSKIGTGFGSYCLSTTKLSFSSTCSPAAQLDGLLLFRTLAPNRFAHQLQNSIVRTATRQSTGSRCLHNAVQNLPDQAAGLRGVWNQLRSFSRRIRRWNRLHCLAATALISFWPVCGVLWYTSRQEIPCTHRWHTVVMTPAAERDIGEQTFNEIKREAAAQGRLLASDHPSVTTLRAVGTKIAEQAMQLAQDGGYTDHLKDVQWEFVMIVAPDVNAFVLPGGKVVMYTGLWNRLTSEDEVAAVIGHEVAHVVARHMSERMTQERLLFCLRVMFYLLVDIYPLPCSATEVAARLALELPHSRKQESEADIIGMQLAARACFQPAAALSMINTLKEAEEESGDELNDVEFLRTHPVSDKRMQRVVEELPQAQAVYNGKDCTAAEDYAQAVGISKWFSRFLPSFGVSTT